MLTNNFKPIPTLYLLGSSLCNYFEDGANSTPLMNED